MGLPGLSNGSSRREEVRPPSTRRIPPEMHRMDERIHCPDETADERVGVLTGLEIRIPHHGSGLSPEGATFPYRDVQQENDLPQRISGVLVPALRKRSGQGRAG